jgi:hypothetical protein
MIFFSEGILDFLMAAADYHRGFGLSINYRFGHGAASTPPTAIAESAISRLQWPCSYPGSIERETL